MHISSYKTITFVSLIFMLIQMPLVGADVIQPGYHQIAIINKIANMQDFSGYTIYAIYGIATTGSLDACPPKIIGADGIVPGYYKLCSVFIYAVSKNYSAPPNNVSVQTSALPYATIQTNYIISSGKLLARGILTSINVPNSDIAPNITVSFALHFGQVVTPNYNLATPPLQYALIFIIPSLVGLVAIILILYCRRSKLYDRKRR